MVSKGTQLVVLLISTAYAMSTRLTTDPIRYRSAGQESNDIRCKVITVKFDKMIRFWTIHILKGKEVFIECILINFGGSAIDNLNWLTMVRFPWD
jgi:hypothetical protein